MVKCGHCGGSKSKKFGKDKFGKQRYKCKECGKVFLESVPKPLGKMRLSNEKAIMCLKCLVEGNSVRSTERLTGVHRDTILRLLETIGSKCERIHYDIAQRVVCYNLELDEIWGFVQMKEKTRKIKQIGDEQVGTCYTFTGIDRETKFMLAWHLGRRTEEETYVFMEKLFRVIKDTTNDVQVSTDAFNGYEHSISEVLGVDYGQVIKEYGPFQPRSEDSRYSPSVCIGIDKKAVSGRPDLDTVSTSIVERANLTMRMSMRRLTRLTNGFSKKFQNLEYALNLNFVYYNYMRIHASLGHTPAMAANLTSTVWEWEDLLGIASAY